MRLLPLLWIVLPCQGLVGQGHPFGKVKIIENTRLFPSGVAVADFDLDGYKDFVVANSFALDVLNGPSTLCLLDGSYKILRKENLPPTGEIGLFSYPTIHSADFNRDMLPDTVTISDRGAVSIHLNQGPTLDPTKHPSFKMNGAFKRIQVMQSVGPHFTSFQTLGSRIGDFNVDGVSDLVLIGDASVILEILGSSGVSVFFGDRKGGFLKEVVLYDGRFIALTSGDFDGNGADDIAAVSDNHELLLILARGGRRFSMEKLTLSIPADPTGLACADLNRDGRDDLIITGKDKETKIHVYLSTERGTIGKRIPVFISDKGFDQLESPIAEDFSGDGLPDFVFLALDSIESPALYFLRGKGDGSFDKEVILALDLEIFSSRGLPSNRLLQAVDMNGDMNPELVIASIKKGSSQGIVQCILPNLSRSRGGVRAFGRTASGIAGQVPRIATYGGGPSLGNRDFGISLSYVPAPGNEAVLMISTHHTPIMGPGFPVEVFPLFTVYRRTGSKGPDIGYALVDLPVPVSIYLEGLTYYFQWLVRDPEAKDTAEISVSKALGITFTR